MVFFKIFTAIHQVYDNHTLYKLAKAEYIKLGYKPKEAQYAALGLMSWYSQNKYCTYYNTGNSIVFERIA